MAKPMDKKISNSCAFLISRHLVAPTVLEIAVNEGKTRRTPRALLAYKGWQCR